MRRYEVWHRLFNFPEPEDDSRVCCPQGQAVRPISTLLFQGPGDLLRKVILVTNGLPRLDFTQHLPIVDLLPFTCGCITTETLKTLCL